MPTFLTDLLPKKSLTVDILWPWFSQIAVACGIFLLVFLLRKYLVRRIFSFLLRLTSRTKSNLDNYLVMALERPLQLFFIILGAYLALIYLPLNMEANILLSRLFRSALVVLAALCIYNLVGNHDIFAEEMSSIMNFNVDRILIPFFSKILKFVVVVLAISVILQEWDYDINGFIAGLGLGGLAFALAAQQTLSNMFGGIVIITDKPFSIGDWISTPSVEGTVEDINFRSTKIRTFAQALVTVPNAVLSNEAITNWTRMGKRQISFNLRVNYNTPQEKMQKCITEIKKMLQDHPGIHKETIMVNFDSFEESWLSVFIYCFTITTKWAEFLQVKEDTNYKIMSILEKENVSLAFPSTSLYFENSIPEVKK